MDITEDLEVCPIHGCPLEDFVSATQEGTEYFTFCPECEEGYNNFLEEDAALWDYQEFMKLNGVEK